AASLRGGPALFGDRPGAGHLRGGHQGARLPRPARAARPDDQPEDPERGGQPMTPTDNSRQVDVTLARYLDALEENDLDVLEAIWKMAERDPTLEAALLEVNAEQALDHAASQAPDPARDDSDGTKGQLSALHAELALPSSLQAEQLVAASYVDYRCRVLLVDD